VPGLLDPLGEVRVDSASGRAAAERLLGAAVAPFAPEAAAAALFAACDAIAAEPYERQEADGSLLLCARGHPCVDELVALVAPVPLRSTRAARKALELSRGELAPLCDGATIRGVGLVARTYAPARADLFEVRFAGRSRWELRHAGERLFAVTRADPGLPPATLERTRLEGLLRSAFPDHDAASVARLWDAVAAVVGAGCGSTVVISPEAAAEARRLSAQGTPIAPRVLEGEVLRCATGIGGAILLDGAGSCHAIGVILDGVAAAQGSASRGSRYNSAAAYVRGRPRTVAVVISDDGSVDVLGGEGLAAPRGSR
jgi:hypothetical protein